MGFMPWAGSNPAAAETSSRFAAHPAALAAAVEAGPSDADRLQAALHLARHGVRWPGAGPRLRQACQSTAAAATPSQRDQLARGLAQLGDSAAALSCLMGSPPSPETQLAIGRALVGGSSEQQAQAESLLLQLGQSRAALQPGQRRPRPW
jgi:hypothetical protein